MAYSSHTLHLISQTILDKEHTLWRPLWILLHFCVTSGLINRGTEPTEEHWTIRTRSGKCVDRPFSGPTGEKKRNKWRDMPCSSKELSFFSRDSEASKTYSRISSLPCLRCKASLVIRSNRTFQWDMLKNTIDVIVCINRKSQLWRNIARPGPLHPSTGHQYPGHAVQMHEPDHQPNYTHWASS